MDFKKDTGYAWMIALSGLLTFCFVFIPPSVISVFMLSMANSFEESFFKISLILSIMNLSAAIFGLFIGLLINVYGCRKVRIFGSLILGFSFTISGLFVYNIYVLYLTLGVCVGIGYVCCYLSVENTVQLWFETKKTLAFGIIVCGISLGIFLWPPISYYLEMYYSWRGAYIIFGGITLNICVFGALLFSPPNQIREDLSLTSIQNLNIKKNFDFSLLKNIPFILYSIGRFAIFAGSSVAYYMLPTKSLILGHESHIGPLFLSVFGLISCFFRPIVGIFGDKKFINRYLVYCISSFLGGLLTVISSYLQSVSLLLVYCGLFAIMNSIFISLNLIVLMDIVKKDHIPLGTGIGSLTNGFGAVVTSTLSGVLFDTYNDIELPFRVLGSIQIIGTILSFCGYLIHEKNKKNIKNVHPILQTIYNNA